MTFENMPDALREICRFFIEKRIRFLLFKCEHILQGKNKNLDLLFETQEGYEDASRLLEKEGFILSIPESVEKYKKMYISFKEGVVTAIHLHREIAWHGLPVLQKKKVFERATKFFPSAEDSLLIHSGHALFENFRVSPFHKKLIEKYRKNAKDTMYMKRHLRNVGWGKAFSLFMKARYNVSNKMILQAYISRLRKSPWYFYNLIPKLLNATLRKFTLKRKGYCIAFVGVNGTGKTTMTNHFMEHMEPLARFLNGTKGYYFGWDPFLPVTKLLSWKGRGKKVYTKEIKKIPPPFQGIRSLYLFIEYYARYMFQIYPALRQGKIVVTDRYFYDQWSQSNHSQYSIWLLDRFPKPDLCILLDAPISIILKRDKNTHLHSKKVIRSPIRKVHDITYLQKQRENYHTLQKRYSMIYLNTTKNINKNVQEISDTIWKKIVKKR